MWLVAVSLVVHGCLLLALARLEPELFEAEQIKETPVEVVIEQPPPPPPPVAQQKNDPAPNAAEKPLVDAQAAPPPAPEAKPPEQKEPEPKPPETPPTPPEQKPAESKPAEQKEPESKPAQEKPAEPKPAESKAVEPKPAESKPAEPKPAEPKPDAQKPEPKQTERKPSPAQAKAAARAAAAVARKEAVEAKKEALEAQKQALEAQKQALEGRKAELLAQTEALERSLSQPAPLTQASPQQANAINAQPRLQLPFDFGPDHFRAVAVPLPTENGDEPMSYKEIVFGLLERAKQFPQAARERGARGKAVVGFSIDEAGELTNVSLLQSSGDADLDIESVALVARASPFPKPPPGAALSFGAEITFGLEPEPVD
jgi:TonB family protein